MVSICADACRMVRCAMLMIQNNTTWTSLVESGAGLCCEKERACARFNTPPWRSGGQSNAANRRARKSVWATHDAQAMFQC